METGNGLGHQPGDGEIGAFTESEGEFIHRQSGGCDLCRGLSRNAAGKCQQQYENQKENSLHGVHVPIYRDSTYMIAHLSRKV